MHFLNRICFRLHTGDPTDLRGMRHRIIMKSGKGDMRFSIKWGFSKKGEGREFSQKGKCLTIDLAFSSY